MAKQDPKESRPLMLRRSQWQTLRELAKAHDCAPSDDPDRVDSVTLGYRHVVIQRGACYNRIFAREFPRTRFVSVGPATVVEKRMGDLLPLLERIIGGTSVLRFRDRDDLTQEEIEDKHAQGVRVMSAYRNIESMLLSDGVLRRFCDTHGKSDCFDAIRTARGQCAESCQWPTRNRRS